MKHSGDSSIGRSIDPQRTFHRMFNRMFHRAFHGMFHRKFHRCDRSGSTSGRSTPTTSTRRRTCCPSARPSCTGAASLIGANTASLVVAAALAPVPWQLFGACRRRTPSARSNRRVASERARTIGDCCLVAVGIDHWRLLSHCRWHRPLATAVSLAAACHSPVGPAAVLMEWREGKFRHAGDGVWFEEGLHGEVKLQFKQLWPL